MLDDHQQFYSRNVNSVTFATDDSQNKKTTTHKTVKSKIYQVDWENKEGDEDFSEKSKTNLHRHFNFKSAKGKASVLTENAPLNTNDDINNVEDQLQEILQPEFITRVGLNMNNGEQKLLARYGIKKIGQRNVR